MTMRRMKKTIVLRMIRMTEESDAAVVDDESGVAVADDNGDNSRSIFASIVCCVVCCWTMLKARMLKKTGVAASRPFRFAYHHHHCRCCPWGSGAAVWSGAFPVILADW